MRIASYINISEPGLLGALNEELSELHRRVQRQSDKFQRLEKVKVGMTETRIPHQLGLLPRSVSIEIIEFPNFLFPDVWFTQRHTKDAVFLRASTDTTVDLVLRG